MSPFHRQLMIKRANLVKRLARQVKPVGKHWDRQQRKEIIKFYVENAMSPLQASYQILNMDVAKLNKLYFFITMDETCKVCPSGLFHNEKMRMVAFCTGKDPEQLNVALQEMYKASPSFNNS